VISTPTAIKEELSQAGTTSAWPNETKPSVPSSSAKMTERKELLDDAQLFLSQNAENPSGNGSFNLQTCSSDDLAPQNFKTFSVHDGTPVSPRVEPTKSPANLELGDPWFSMKRRDVRAASGPRRHFSPTVSPTRQSVSMVPRICFSPTHDAAEFSKPSSVFSLSEASVQSASARHPPNVSIMPTVQRPGSLSGAPGRLIQEANSPRAVSGSSTTGLNLGHRPVTVNVVRNSHSGSRRQINSSALMMSPAPSGHAVPSRRGRSSPTALNQAKPGRSLLPNK